MSVTLKMKQKITESDVIVYTHGDCWVLAWALHKMTGYTPVFVGDSRYSTDWAHMMVRTPEGMYLDVNGLHTKEEVLEQWSRECEGYARIFTVPSTRLIRFMGEENNPSSVDASFATKTRAIARTLLAK